jgi:hypothetical protein
VTGSLVVDGAPWVLVLGLDPYRVPGPWDPAPVADALAAGRPRFAELGLRYRECLVGLDGSEDVLASIAGALRARAWDCVVVGGGIRSGELGLFEDVVNLVHRLAPGAVVAFNASPGECAEAASLRLGAC